MIQSRVTLIENEYRFYSELLQKLKAKKQESKFIVNVESKIERLISLHEEALPFNELFKPLIN